MIFSNCDFGKLLRLSILMAVILGVLSSCGPGKQAAGRPDLQGRRYARAARGGFELVQDRARFASAADDRPYRVSSYHIRGRFDWETSTLTATVAIRLTLDPTPPTSLVLDSQVDAIDAVSIFGYGAVPYSVDREHGLLTSIWRACRPRCGWWSSS
jgi:hypothetical protein